MGCRARTLPEIRCADDAFSAGYPNHPYYNITVIYYYYYYYYAYLIRVRPRDLGQRCAAVRGVFRLRPRSRIILCIRGAEIIINLAVENRLKNRTRG